MNWIWAAGDRLGTWARRAAAAALTAGGRPVPRHIAFISECAARASLGSHIRSSGLVACLPAHLMPRPAPPAVDGNRRYAEARALRKVEGHAYGYARLLDALEWCLQVGCGLCVGGT